MLHLPHLLVADQPALVGMLDVLRELLDLPAVIGFDKFFSDLRRDAFNIPRRSGVHQAILSLRYAGHLFLRLPAKLYARVVCLGCGYSHPII